MRFIARICSIVFVIVFFGAAQQARAVVFSVTDWSGVPGAVTDVFSSGVIGFSVTTPTSGGNPGSAFQLSTSLSGGSALTSRFIAFNGFTYDPGVSGAIDSFDFSVDKRNVDSTHGTGVGFKQDGFVYYLSLPAGSPVYQTFSGAGIDAGSLVSAVAGPIGPGLDFSASGSLIEMGLFAFSSAASATTLFDNWTITLNQAEISVPAPGAAAIFAIGLVGMGIARKRRA